MHVVSDFFVIFVAIKLKAKIVHINGLIAVVEKIFDFL